MSCDVSTWLRPKTYPPPRAHSEMALELVSGADFWCKLMSGGRPVDQSSLPQLPEPSGGALAR